MRQTKRPRWKNGLRPTSATHSMSHNIRWSASTFTSVPQKHFSSRSLSTTRFSMAGAMRACSPKLHRHISMNWEVRLSIRPCRKRNFVILSCWSCRRLIPRSTAGSGRNGWKAANSSGYRAGNPLQLARTAELVIAKSKFQTIYPMRSNGLLVCRSSNQERSSGRAYARIGDAQRKNRCHDAPDFRRPA